MNRAPVNTFTPVPAALKRLTVICCLLVVIDIMLVGTVGYLVYHKMMETSLKHVETSQDVLQNNKFLVEETQQTDGDINKMREKINHFNITVDKIAEEMAEIETDFDSFRKESNETTFYLLLNEIQTMLSHLDISVYTMQKEILNLEDADELREAVEENSNGGTIYIRWGKTTCPGNGSEAIYNGYVAGATLDLESGSDVLCMPRDPEWNNYDHSLSGEYIVGAEYHADELFGNAGNHKYYNVSCVVCNVKARSSMIMIPARRNCYPGWTFEYAGYLMNSHDASDFLCVDEHPENIPDSNEQENSLALIFVSSFCESLQCPPYVKNRQMTCVVCTK